MQQIKQCQFKSKGDKDFICSEPTIEGSDYCIFHKPNKTEDETKLFKEKIHDKLQNNDCNFKGYHFSVSPSFNNYQFNDFADFQESTFEGYAYFSGSIFEGGSNFLLTTFKKDAFFSRSVFKQDVHFNEASFGQKAHFENCTFKSKACFKKSIFKGEASFQGSLFEGEIYFGVRIDPDDSKNKGSTFEKNANFGESTFRKDAYFEFITFKKIAFFRRSKFLDYAGFENSIFRDVADFWGSTFLGTARFFRCRFKDLVDFQESLFQREACFRNSSFESEARFEGTTFKGVVTFDQAIFTTNINLWGAMFERVVSFQNTEFIKYTSAEQCYRVAKSSYQKHGEYTCAGEYYYKEKIARRKQLPWYSLKRWLEYIFLDGICGYGERPWRAIKTGLGVIAGLALIYWQIGHIYISPELSDDSHVLNFLDALYFSVVTFTTLGLGDWRPDPSHWIRYFVAVEAFIGAFLMALFIMTFGRRMMR